MKKIVALIGGILVILGIILPLVDMTLGWWQITYTTEIWGNESITKYFLSSFGTIANDGNDDTVQVEGAVLILIAIIIIIGALLVVAGPFINQKKNNILPLLGSILIIAGLVYFCYSLGNFPEIVDLIIDDDAFALFGKDTYTFIVSTELQWRLGNGFFIAAAGAGVALAGSIMKDR